MQTSGDRSRRFADLTPEDAALVYWVGDGCPVALLPLVARLERSGIVTLNVGRGWWPLLKRLDHDIAALAPGYRIGRLGEDGGVLDFVMRPVDVGDDLEALVSEAQSESTRTCEICADKAWLYRQGDWLVTLCIDHARVSGARPARADRDISEATPRPADERPAFMLSTSAPASAFGAVLPHENGVSRHVFAPMGEAGPSSPLDADADDAKSPWADVIGPCYTLASLGRALGRSQADLIHAVTELRLLGLPTADNETLFPSFQVHGGRVYPDLATVLKILRSGIDDPWTWAQWLNTPSCDGGVQMDALWSGRLADVVLDASHDAWAWRS